MDPELLQFLAATGAGLIGGGVTKKISKANASQSHQALSPAVVAVIAVVANMVAGDSGPELAISATQAAVAAIGIHSAAKNIYQLLKRKRKG